LDPIAPPESPSGVTLNCWGVRGSIPTPGPSTVRFGGNTPCVEIRAGGRRVILDAGTGIRLLGARLLAEAGSGGPDEVRVFLTHFHWDHVQGLPFFAPLHDPRFHLSVFAPEQEGGTIDRWFARQMGPVYFPVRFEEVAARLAFFPTGGAAWEEGEEAWESDGFRVTGLRMRHPSHTLGYKVEVEGVRICYLPDNELEGGNYPVDGGDWTRRLDRFVADADLLIHDAMYTDGELPARGGWGHSTGGQALDLAARNCVKRLLLFHHAPERQDDDLDRIAAQVGDRSDRIGGPRVEPAREGETFVLTEG